eukprot:SAG31_NODE_439_length_15675_cov_6.578390_16_plen_179_part_00
MLRCAHCFRPNSSCLQRHDKAFDSFLPVFPFFLRQWTHVCSPNAWAIYDPLQYEIIIWTSECNVPLPRIDESNFSKYALKDQDVAEYATNGCEEPGIDAVGSSHHLDLFLNVESGMNALLIHWGSNKWWLRFWCLQNVFIRIIGDKSQTEYYHLNQIMRDNFESGSKDRFFITANDVG